MQGKNEETRIDYQYLLTWSFHVREDALSAGVTLKVREPAASTTHTDVTLADPQRFAVTNKLALVVAT